MALDLRSARVLVSNDDGIEASGIHVLEKIAASLSEDVWTVAPLYEQSGVAHSLTLHDPLRIRNVADKRYAVVGTPSDAVLLGAVEILADKKPQLVLSGVNRGANVAEDVTYSGTIAAAMEGTLLEIPSIALSTAIRNTDPHAITDWSAPERFAADIIRSLVRFDWPHGTLMNINFPGLPAAEVKGIRVCPQGRRKIDGEKLHKRLDPRGREYYWIGGPGATPFDEVADADYRLLLEGYITVTPIQMDLTHYGILDRVRSALEGK